MNVLSIGNSFSCDATRYLHQIAKAGGIEINSVNLFIGGCSLWQHYVNALGDSREYDMYYNGEETRFKVSIKEALVSREWDIITLQQASYKSVDYKTYQPYLDFMKEYVKKYSPKSKIYIHQTWEYGKENKLLSDGLGYDNPSQMLDDLRTAYEEAAKAINADGIILSGELIGRMARDGIKIHRDNHHVTLGLGRYALGLLWYTKLTGKAVEDNKFSDFDEEIKEEYITYAKKCVSELSAL